MSTTENVAELLAVTEETKGTVSGTIKGKITHWGSGIITEFDAPYIWRDHEQRFRFFGNMDDPNLPGNKISVGLTFKDADQGSGDFQWDDEEIEDLFFANWRPDQILRAQSGSVTFRRNAEDRIHGRLEFITRPIELNQYTVEVIYDIEAPR